MNQASDKLYRNRSQSLSSKRISSVTLLGMSSLLRLRLHCCQLDPVGALALHTETDTGVARNAVDTHSITEG